MPARKELKRRGKLTFRRHYLLLVAVCLIAAFLGVEYTGATSVVETVRKSESGSVADSGTSIAAGLNGVWSVLAEGDLTEGTILADDYISEKASETSSRFLGFTLGRSRGVFAEAVNLFSSGDILVRLWSGIHHIVKNGDLTTVIFMVLSLGLYLFIKLFITSVYTVISRRVVLEARIYKVIPTNRFAFLLSVKKWFHVAVVLLAVGALETLWGITIVGGVIMYFAYGMVPYILAENPDVSTREAARLSRFMMRGHKWELLKLELSFLGWQILNVLTFGILGVFWVNPYHAAVKAEYYAYLRSLAKENGVDGAELLNDTYLFKKALKKAYLDVAGKKPVKLPKTGGVRGFFAEIFGVVLSQTKESAEYDAALERNVLYERVEHILNGDAYPERLFPIPEHERRSRLRTAHYLRRYTLLNLVMMFYAFSLVGWLWEVSLHVIKDGAFVNRGVLHGPWLPIYGGGGLLILTVLYRFRKRPGQEFALAVILCGVVEHFSSWYLEVTHNGMKWWDYSGYFLNINGRVCAEGLLVFGLGGIAMVYFLAPLIDDVLSRISRKN